MCGSPVSPTRMRGTCHRLQLELTAEALCFSLRHNSLSHNDLYTSRYEIHKNRRVPQEACYTVRAYTKEFLMSSETLAQLAERIRDIEANARPLNQTTIPFPPLAEALPDGGLPTGSLVEVLSALEGGGAWTFAMLLARCACGERKTLVVADPQRSFYPPAAARLGIDLERTLILRPSPGMSAAIPGGVAA